MNIRLYGENDTRPQGNYNNVRTVEIFNNSGRVGFITQMGISITTTLRYKLTFTKDDKLTNFETDNSIIYEDTFYKSEQKAKPRKSTQVKQKKEDKGIDTPQGKLAL